MSDYSSITVKELFIITLWYWTWINTHDNKISYCLTVQIKYGY